MPIGALGINDSLWDVEMLLTKGGIGSGGLDKNATTSKDQIESTR